MVLINIKVVNNFFVCVLIALILGCNSNIALKETPSNRKKSNLSSETDSIKFSKPILIRFIGLERERNVEFVKFENGRTHQSEWWFRENTQSTETDNDYREFTLSDTIFHNTTSISFHFKIDGVRHLIFCDKLNYGWRISYPNTARLRLESYSLNGNLRTCPEYVGNPCFEITNIDM